MRGKLFYIFIILSTFLVNPAFTQSYEGTLLQADSLFEARKYTEAFDLYENILEKSDHFSFQMLLKMSFIKEGLGDYTSALYYLNLYYNYKPEKKVLKKMEDLAAKHKLSGYRYTDLEYFISLYNQYYYYIIFFFLFSAFSYFLHLVLKKFRKKKLGFRPVVFIFILGTAYLLTNYDIIPPKGIVSNSGTLLMTAPSAASEPLATIDKGHRVIILDKTDVWYRILWDNKAVYVLENNLLLIGEPKNFTLF